MMGNKLTTLPAGVCELVALHRLGLKGNRLGSLPDNFGNLTNLVELFITDNALKSLPESIQHCTALVKLQVLAPPLADSLQWYQLRASCKMLDF